MRRLKYRYLRWRYRHHTFSIQFDNYKPVTGEILLTNRNQTIEYLGENRYLAYTIHTA
jgi:hypothetical protein